MRLPEESYSPVPPVQFSVWKGEAGRPSRLQRLGWAARCQAKRTWVGVATLSALTTTWLPSISALAVTNFPSAPEILNSLRLFRPGI